jgi:membrane-associated phospholipid phosphatase
MCCRKHQVSDEDPTTDSVFAHVSGCWRHRLDTSVASGLNVLRGDQLHAITTWVTKALLAATLVVMGAGVGLRRGATLADVCRVLVLLAVGLLLVESVKLFISRERPGGPWQHPSASGSFPSGHVANVALCLAAALALVRQLQDRRDVVRALLTGAGSLLVIAVAFTHVYLGLHWLSDVTGSILLGMSFAGMLAARPTVRWPLLRALVLLVLPVLYLMAACGVHVAVPSPAAGLPGAGASTFDEPMSSRYVLIPRAHLVNVTSLGQERWKRAHPEFCRKFRTE